MTKEQFLTQTLDRSISVTANAGTGKTYVLVQRYIEILQECFKKIQKDSGYSVFDIFNPKNILAITFTKKAAAEMKLKVIRDIEKKILESTKSGKDANNTITKERFELKIIRGSLSAARISTIHSFCSSIIRDFSIEAGILPNFYELGNAEKARIENDCILSITEEWLKSNDAAKSDTATEAVMLFKKKDYVNFIKDIIGKRNIFERLKSFYSMSDDEFIRLRNKELALFLVSMKSRFEDLLAFSKFGIYKEELSPKYKKLVALGEVNIEKLLKSLADIVTDHSFKKISELYTSCIEIKQSYFLKNGKGLFSDILKKSDPDKSAHIIKTFDNVFNDFKDIQDSLLYESLDLEMFHFSRELFSLTKDILIAIEHDKKELSALDFDDLLLIARDLLKIEKVRKKVASKIDFMMVDEFQDTNDIQYEIIKLLIPELTGKNCDSGINLFIVGDGKQSIYGFRNADIRVFMQARKDIQKLNSKLIKSNELDKDISIKSEAFSSLDESISTGKLDLKVTFRLNPVPASFVNYICREIMQPGTSEFEVEYSDFIAAKGAEKLINDTNENIGKVSFIFSKEKAENEVDLIAAYIKKLINDPEYTIIDKDNIERRPTYSDFGILSRKKNIFAMLGEALSQYEIPYTIFSGSGFFASQEIMDITSFLKFLHNPNDDASFAAILRSPFFDIYDDKLLQISIEPKKSLWEKYMIWIENNYDIETIVDDTAIVEAPLRAYRILKLMLSLAPRLTLSQLIIKILDECSWFSTASISAGYKQKEANMEKFIQYSRDFEERGFKNLYDFVEELEFIQSEGFKEEEAAFITGEEAVAIMTIHAAKGLEFPVVILADTNSGTRGNQSCSINDYMGISFKMPFRNSDGTIIRVQSPAYKLSSKWSKAASDAEEKRLLYVAMTRAISHLAISARVKEISNGYEKTKSMLKLILEGLNSSVDFLGGNDNFPINDKINLFYNKEIIEKELNYEVDIVKSAEYIDQKSASKQVFKTNQIDLIKGIAPEPFDNMFSATKLALFKDDHDQFVNRYVLGFKEYDDDNKFNYFVKKENAEEDAHGTKAGTLIHQTLESIKDWISPDGTVNTKVLNDAIDRVLMENSKYISDDLRRRINQECSYISSTRLLREYSSFIKDSKTEHYLQMPVNNNILVGSIDMLIKNKDGDFEIWDWKSNHVSGEKQMKELAKHYEMQMKVYAGLFSLAEPTQENIICRLLFTRRANTKAKDEEWTHTFKWYRSQASSFLTEIGKYITEINKY